MIKRQTITYSAITIILMAFIGLIVIIPNVLENNITQIAYVANLTGPNSLQAIGGLNGAMMGLQDFESGPNSINLTVVDMANFESDTSLFEKLDTLKPDLILGGTNSTEYLRLKPYILSRKTPCLGVAVSLDQETGKKDYFFRLSISAASSASKAAHYAINQLNFRRTFILYDDQNSVYSRSFSTSFAKAMPRWHHCQVDSITNFSLSPEMIKDFDSVLLIAPPQTAGLTIQKIRTISYEIPILMSAWSLSDLTHQYTGGLDQNLYFTSTYKISQSVAYLDFSKRYYDQYAQDVNVAATLAYESIAFLKTIVQERNFRNDRLIQTLQKQHEVNGPFNHYNLDEYGDVIRPIYLLKYDNGSYIDMTD